MSKRKFENLNGLAQKKFNVYSPEGEKACENNYFLGCESGRSIYIHWGEPDNIQTTSYLIVDAVMYLNAGIWRLID